VVESVVPDFRSDGRTLIVTAPSSRFGDLAMLTAILALCGCGEGSESAADVAQIERGATALGTYGCGTCHRIPGIAGARGNVGPSLEGLAGRVYLAGIMPNTEAELARWIQSPQQISPLAGMPDMQVSPDDARAMAAYLHRARAMQ
jgi:cytochrome c